MPFDINIAFFYIKPLNEYRFAFAYLTESFNFWHLECFFHLLRFKTTKKIISIKYFYTMRRESFVNSCNNLEISYKENGVYWRKNNGLACLHG